MSRCRSKYEMTVYSTYLCPPQTTPIVSSATVRGRRNPKAEFSRTRYRWLMLNLIINMSKLHPMLMVLTHVGNHENYEFSMPIGD